MSWPAIPMPISSCRYEDITLNPIEWANYFDFMHNINFWKSLRETFTFKPIFHESENKSRTSKHIFQNGECNTFIIFLATPGKLNMGNFMDISILLPSNFYNLHNVVKWFFLFLTMLLLFHFGFCFSSWNFKDNVKWKWIIFIFKINFALSLLVISKTRHWWIRFSFYIM